MIAAQPSETCMLLGLVTGICDVHDEYGVPESQSFEARAKLSKKYRRGVLEDTTWYTACDKLPDDHFCFLRLVI